MILFREKDFLESLFLITGTKQRSSLSEDRLCLDHSLIWYQKVICASAENSIYKIFISIFFLKSKLVTPVTSDLDEYEW